MSTADQSSAARTTEIVKNFAFGCATSFVLNTAMLTCWMISASEVCFYGLLLLQPTYLMVAVTCALRKHRPGLASGLISGAALTVMALPAMCFGFVLLGAHH